MNWELKYIKGDLIEDAENYDVIAHGCNCFHSFGAGIAKTIRLKYPEAHVVDKNTRYGDRDKMGTISVCELPNVTIVNAYTQFKYTSIKLDVEYDAVRECMKKIKERFSGKKIGLPLIGCGLAGGDWDIVSKIIEEELEGEDVTIVLFDK